MTVLPWHRDITMADMESVKKLLKEHYGVEADIKFATREKAPFWKHDIDVMTAIALNAQVVVELGTGGGGSTDGFVIAMKKTGGRLYSVDNMTWGDNKQIFDTIKRHANSPVTFITGDSTEEGKKWNKGDIDILYHDANHSYNKVLQDLEAWKHSNPKVTFIHDTFGTNPHGSINPPYRAAEDYAKKHGRLFVNIAIMHGLGIII